MKMTKKILLGAVALSTAVVFTSCDAIFSKTLGDISWEAKYAKIETRESKIEQTNEEDHTIRGMKRLGALNRAQATCILQQFDQGKDTRDGMVGFIAGYEENVDENGEKDGTFNFLVTGIQSNNGNTYTYVSYYCNITEDSLSTLNFGANDGNGNEVTRDGFVAEVKTPYEIPLVKYQNNDVDAKLNNAGVKYDENGTLYAGIRFVGADNGSFDVFWYGSDLQAANGSESGESNYEKAKVIASKNIPAGLIGRNEKSGKGSMWYYANIYEGKTLKAQFDSYDVSWSQEKLRAAEEDTVIGDIDWN